MRIDSVPATTKDGEILVIRNPEAGDADSLLESLAVVCGETPFLLREEKEVSDISHDDEVSFIESYNSGEGHLLLIACIDGNLAGNCSFAPVGSLERVRHRCSLGIAVKREFWGRGIGEKLMTCAMTEAKKYGYEIMELDVMSKNVRAISMYQKLGFEIVGERPDSIKYSDGTYSSEYIMSTRL